MTITMSTFKQLDLRPSNNDATCRHYPGHPNPPGAIPTHTTRGPAKQGMSRDVWNMTEFFPEKNGRGGGANHTITSKSRVMDSVLNRCDVLLLFSTYTLVIASHAADKNKLQVEGCLHLRSQSPQVTWTLKVAEGREHQLGGAERM